MSDDYKVQITISLPPTAQYAKGDMLNVRGSDADDLLASLTGLFDAEAAGAVIAKFRSYAVTVPEAMSVDQVAAALSAPPKYAQEATAAWKSRSPQTGGGGGGMRKSATEKQVGLIQRTASEKGLSADQVLDLASQVTNKGFRPSNVSGLSSFEASKLIDLLRDSAGNVAV